MYRKNCDEYQFLERYQVLQRNLRILNLGSGSVRYGENCLNVDIQPKENVDVVCDFHEIPDSLGKFDVVICNAALQYCRNPWVVADKIHDLLVDNGYVFVDAPFIQPYCRDMPDRFRFSEDGLREVFARFEILEVGPSMRPGSALCYLGLSIARSLTPNRYFNFAAAKLVDVLMIPLRGLKTHNESVSAGAFYLVGRKRPSKDTQEHHAIGRMGRPSASPQQLHRPRGRAITRPGFGASNRGGQRTAHAGGLGVVTEHRSGSVWVRRGCPTITKFRTEGSPARRHR